MNLRNLENWKYMRALINISRKDAKAHSAFLNYTKILIAIIFPSIAFSQAQVLPIDSVLKKIELSHPMLKSYKQKADAFQTYASGAKALMAPEVGGGFWMTPYPGEKVDPMNKGQFMLTVQQKFTNPAKLNASQKYLSSQSNIEEANAKIFFNELRSEARISYAERIAFEKKNKTLKESEESALLALKIAKLRYSLNQEKLGTIYKMEARIGEIQNELINNATQIQQKTIALNRLMNLPNSNSFAVDTAFVMDRDLIINSEVHDQSVVHKIDQTIESLKLNQQTELAQAKPDFSLSFSHMVPLGAMPNQFMLQGMVSIPIAPWAAKSYKANSLAIEKEIESMKREKESVMNELNQKLSNTVVEISSTQKQLESYEKRILPMLQKNYDLTFQSYEENKEELTEVINAWEALLTAQLQHIDLQLKLNQNQITYEKLLDK